MRLEARQLVRPQRLGFGEPALELGGRAMLEAIDADARVEGRMAKNPSFWTTRVHIVRYYERIAGVRVPVRVDSKASIRFAGESTLSMTYRYETINGVAVD